MPSDPVRERPKEVQRSMGLAVKIGQHRLRAANWRLWHTLYGIADAVAALKYDQKDCRVLSVGCGNYPTPKEAWYKRVYRRVLPTLPVLEKTLSVNIASMEQLRVILFKQVPTVRINDTFDKPEMATDLFEHNLEKLNILRQRGAESFASREADIRTLLKQEA